MNTAAAGRARPPGRDRCLLRRPNLEAFRAMRAAGLTKFALRQRLATIATRLRWASCVAIDQIEAALAGAGTPVVIVSEAAE